MTPPQPDPANFPNLHPKAAWAQFDAAFYAATNPTAPDQADTHALLHHYLTHGAAAGASPNRWFDETFYRRTHADVENLIQTGACASGFEHYCRTGYPTHAPHWLFDPAYYAAANPQLTDDVLKNAGFANAYDHFLKYGDAEGRLCHPLFDPAAYLAALDPHAATACKATGAVKHFLTQRWATHPTAAPEPQVSQKFDPAQYLHTHPDAAGDIRAGLWHSALHHYLAHRPKNTLLPSPSGDPEAPGQIKIHVDRPRHANGQTADPIDGHLDIIGWAAADHPVSAVDIYLDNDHLGRAHHGIRTEGVAAAFPNLSHALFAGFRFIAPAPAAPGRHSLRITATGQGGLQTSETFVADFKPAVLQDGPWNLRRRMRASEADQKTRLIEESGRALDFTLIFTDPAAPEDFYTRARKTLGRQVFTRWRLHTDASPPPAASPHHWLVPLGPGDELGVDALLELALYLAARPATDFVYSDERRRDPSDATMAPFFKPDWSPDLLLATDYIGRLWAASAPLVARAGLSEKNLAAHTNHDLVLRLTEQAACIGHVPLVLCESAPRPPDRQAVQRALARRGIEGRVEQGRAPHTWRIRAALAAPPRVSVIIPTAGARGLVEATLHALRRGTDYTNLEVIVVDSVPGTPAPWKATIQGLADLLLEDAAPFNWSRVNNRAAAHASGEVLLFLNDDIALPEEAADPAWLHTMVENLLVPGIGVVGPQLLYPTGQVQHAGMFLHRGGARNAFAGLAGAAPGPFGQALTQRNVSAVTGACLLVRRAVFDRLGGFDERFGIVCNDTDFCLRCLASGWRVIYTPHATLIHHESVTRTGRNEAADEALFAETWRQSLLDGDAYFSRHLSPDYTDYRPDPEFVEAIYPARPVAAPETIRRILVIKLDQLGDFLLSLPAIRHLAAFFPAARITLLATPDVCRLAATQPEIAETIACVFPPPEQGGLQAIAETLQAGRYDLAVDLRCHTETRPVLQASGATWRAGFDQGYAFPWLDIVAAWEPDVAGSRKRTNMADTLLALATHVTAAFTPPTFLRADGLARPAWPACIPPPPPGTRMRIAIHAGAGTTIKRWPASHFSALIDSLAAATPSWIVLVGAASEADLAAGILAALPTGAAVSAVGLTDIGDLSALLANCDLFIGNDSFPQHLAAGLGVPTIGIQSGVVDAREWSPQGPRAISLRRRTYCSPCYLTDASDCPRSLACLTDLGQRWVLAHLPNTPPGSLMFEPDSKE
jgi:ADP-heptose:LPS heptosyltransferase/glycosyltransferase involved in cell wall biosynthesis